MELYLPVAGFRAGIEDFKKQIEELGKRPVADEAEMQQCKNDLQSIKRSAADYIITNSSKDIGPELAGSIRSENDFQVPGNRSLAEQTRKFRERCESRLHALDAVLLTIDASDPLVEGRSFAEERADLTVEEKQEFLLLKLYQLRKASGYWEAADIFRHNQVGMDNHGEVRGICEELEYGGLIDVLGTLGSYAVRITPQGKKIVEKAIREQTAAEQVPGKSDLDIFISHSSKDSDAAGLLVELLKAAFNLPSKKIRCSSLVNYGLPAGSSIDEQLKNEVHGCRMLIGLLSVNSLQSAYVLFELGARWGASKPLIPLLIDRESGKLLDGPLKGIHAMACWEEAQLYQLLNQVGEQLGLESEAPPVFQKQIRQLAGYHTGE